LEKLRQERQDENSPAIYGWVRNVNREKVPSGTAEYLVNVRKHLSSLPGLFIIRNRQPSLERLGYSHLPIPQGLNHPAQGWPQKRATLGKRPAMHIP
jgi:hypothetical protein